jgi:hypothetical protein
MMSLRRRRARRSVSQLARLTGRDYLDLVGTDGGGCDAVRTALIGHRNALCPAQGRERSRLARVVAPDVLP